MYSLNIDNIKGTVMENYFITLTNLVSYRQLYCVYGELKNPLKLHMLLSYTNFGNAHNFTILMTEQSSPMEYKCN